MLAYVIKVLSLSCENSKDPRRSGDLLYCVTGVDMLAYVIKVLSLSCENCKDPRRSERLCDWH